MSTTMFAASALLLFGPAVDAGQRNLIFDVADRPLKLTLFEADPSLLEQRFAAIVRYKVPTMRLMDREVMRLGFGNRMPGISTSPLAKLGPIHGLFYQVRPTRIGSSLERQSSRLFSSLLPALFENIAADRIPDNASMRLFRRRDVDLYVHIGSTPVTIATKDELGRPVVQYLEFRLLAETVDGAKDRAVTLVNLFDQGLFKHRQDHYRAASDRHLKTLAELKSQLEESLTELASLQEHMDELDEISSEALTTLKTQQWQLEVDLAGVTARIRACENLLAANNLRVARVEQVENIKIAAEIDLAGLMAKKQTIDAIVKKGKERTTLAAKVSELEGSSTAIRAGSRINRRGKGIAGLRISIENTEQSLAESQQMSREYTPSELVDGLILIRPVKWEKRQSENN